MRIAISSWSGRVAPVFDVARQVELYELDAAVLGERRLLPLPEDPLAKAHCLAEAGAQELICGALSQGVREGLVMAGLRVHGFIAGDVPAVLAAWQSQRLHEHAFAMPGCCGGRHRRFQHGQGEGLARCPACGYVTPRHRGQPCRELLCPQCELPLSRG